MRSFVGTTLLALLVALAACRANEPDGRAENTCFDRCTAQLKDRCDEDQCVRGCRFVLDRLVEHEGRNVLACMAQKGDAWPDKKGAECSDQAWATCAARVGIHADGGPPAPPPPNDNWD